MDVLPEQTVAGVVTYRFAEDALDDGTAYDIIETTEKLRDSLMSIHGDDMDFEVDESGFFSLHDFSLDDAVTLLAAVAREHPDAKFGADISYSSTSDSAQLHSFYGGEYWVEIDDAKITVTPVAPPVFSPDDIASLLNDATPEPETKPVPLDLKTKPGVHVWCRNLSRLNRYCGNTTMQYTVAHHLIAGLEILQKAEPRASGRDLLMWLLHDATEAGTGDIISPLKRQMSDSFALEEIEARHAVAVAREVAVGYGTVLEASKTPGVVGELDKAIVAAEWFSVVDAESPYITEKHIGVVDWFSDFGIARETATAAVLNAASLSQDEAAAKLSTAVRKHVQYENTK